MPHLSDLRLAALADDVPTRAEASHLGRCAACARERDAYLALATMAHAARDSIAPPLTRWGDVVEGLAGPLPPAAPATRRGDAHALRGPRRLAAALLLCLGGAALGRWSAGTIPLPERLTAAASEPVAPGEPPVRPTTRDATAFSSVAEARMAQERSRRVLEHAAAYLAQHDSGGGDAGPVLYRSRLAALDQVISSTRAAMRDGPYDPSITDYYETTIGQREATLRQLNTVLPASLRLNSF